MSQENQTPVVEEPTGTEVEETTNETTEEETVENPTESDVDYKKKFSESSREAQRLLEENRKAQEELERLRETHGNYPGNESDANYGDNSENLYPGFENLSEDEQNNLLNYTNSIKKKITDDIYKDPSIAFAKESYNQRKFDTAFDTVVQKFPELRETGDEFKKKYYKKDNVPDNIDEILTDLAKVHLFDRAKDLGAKEAAEQANRIDIERSSGGDRSAPKTTSRTLEDWNKLAQSNPAKFAAMSDEYKKDLESGKLK